jgi:hypothetical protein
LMRQCKNVDKTFAFYVLREVSQKHMYFAYSFKSWSIVKATQWRNEKQFEYLSLLT